MSPPRLHPAVLGLAAALLLPGAAAADPPTSPPAPSGAPSASAPVHRKAGTVKGGLAYMKPIRFDYERNGTRPRVQFFLYFDGKSAVGEEGKPGYEPAEGTVQFIVYDLDKKRRVENWLRMFHMDFPNPTDPFPMTNLVIQGKKAEFDAFHIHWTVVDGGKGYQKDTVTVDDHFIPPHVVQFFAGDLTVTPPR